MVSSTSPASATTSRSSSASSSIFSPLRMTAWSSAITIEMVLMARLGLRLLGARGRADAPRQRGRQVQRGDDTAGAALLVQDDQLPGSMLVHEIGGVLDACVKRNRDRRAGCVERTSVLAAGGQVQHVDVVDHAP